MGVREFINRNSKPVIGIVAVVVVLAAFFSVSDDRVVVNAASAKAWYTVDDGRTWFADQANKIVPFDHGGKPAYRCHVWTCDGGKTKFVSHLERMTLSARNYFQGKTEIDSLDRLPGTEEVKPPLTGDARWMSPDSPEAQNVLRPRCPDGQGNIPRSVTAQ